MATEILGELKNKCGLLRYFDAVKLSIDFCSENFRREECSKIIMWSIVQYVQISRSMFLCIYRYSWIQIWVILFSRRRILVFSISYMFVFYLEIEKKLVVMICRGWNWYIWFEIKIELVPFFHSFNERSGQLLARDFLRV